jgi:mannitol/fructose-specific phosphotransferase system IIA component (Ntr-type)
LSNQIGHEFDKIVNYMDFGNKDNVPVSVVISLGAIDNYLHSKALSTLVNLFNDKEKVEILRNANPAEDILPLLKDKNED